MKRNTKHCGLQQSEAAASSSSLTSKKPERKVVEKNRRNNMKLLYSQLFSLLPHHHLTSMGGFLMPNRIDEAIEYIKVLKTKLETSKGKKEKLLMSSKRSHKSVASDSYMMTPTCKPPNIEIHEMGCDLDVVLITGIPDHSSFCFIIRELNQYCNEVMHASFSAFGACTFHIHHKKIGAADMSKKLKELFEGSSNNQESAHGSSYNKIVDSNLEMSKLLKELFEGSSNNQESTFNEIVDSNLELCDFEIQPDIWELITTPEVMMPTRM